MIRRRGLWLLPLLLPALWQVGADPPEEAPKEVVKEVAAPEQFTPDADHRLLDEIYEEKQISTHGSAEYSEYFVSLRRRLLGKLGVALGAGALLVPIAMYVLWALVVAVAAWLLFLAARLFLRRQQAPAEPSRGPELDPLEEVEQSDDLASRFEDEIARGAARAALRTLWLLVARELAGKGIGRFEAEVTNREFVTSVKRTTPGFSKYKLLRQLASTSEWMLYSSGRIRAEDVLPLRGIARKILS